MPKKKKKVVLKKTDKPRVEGQRKRNIGSVSLMNRVISKRLSEEEIPIANRIFEERGWSKTDLVEQAIIVFGKDNDKRASHPLIIWKFLDVIESLLHQLVKVVSEFRSYFEGKLIKGPSLDSTLDSSMKDLILAHSSPVVEDETTLDKDGDNYDGNSLDKAEASLCHKGRIINEEGALEESDEANEDLNDHDSELHLYATAISKINVTESEKEDLSPMEEEKDGASSEASFREEGAV